MDIRKKVLSIIKKCGTDDPEKIAAHLKVHVRFKEYRDGTKGYYYPIIRNKFVVVNSLLDEVEQKFVLAHELGHAVLHSNKNIKFVRENTLFSVGKHEVEANEFAAHLLIKDDLLEKYPDYYTIYQIASCENIPHEFLRIKFDLKD